MTPTMKHPPIRFRFAPIKCLQAVQWMLLTADKPLGIQTILKAAYFADKRMLNERSRPVFGATYRAMNTARYRSISTKCSNASLTTSRNSN